MGRYVKVADRPRPKDTGSSGFEYFHWRYGKRFWRGCRVRTHYGEGVVTSAYTHINVRIPGQWGGKPVPFHPNDLEILEDQS